MAKPPAFQFYVRDWLSDPALQSCTSSTKGLWINALCYMWEATERGKLVGTRGSMARLLGATEVEMDQFMADAHATKFANVTESDGKVTLINRRMAREEKERAGSKLRMRRHRGCALGYGDVAPPSSSSSSSSSSVTKVTQETPTESCAELPLAPSAPAPPPAPAVIEIPLIPKDGLYTVSQAQVDEWTLAYPGVDVLAELRKIVAWCRANPTKRKTRRGAARFLNLWLSKAQDRPPQARVPAAGVPVSSSSIFDQPMQLPNKRAFDGR